MDNRKDICLLPLVHPVGGDVPLGQAITGQDRIAQWVVKTLLTELGSVTGRPQYGTRLRQALQALRANSAYDVASAIRLAINDLRRLLDSPSRVTNPVLIENRQPFTISFRQISSRASLDDWSAEGPVDDSSSEAVFQLTIRTSDNQVVTTMIPVSLNQII